MTAYLRPRDLAEASAARASHPDWMVLAGGTDLLVRARHQTVPTGILDLWRLPALCGVAPVADGGLRIGAGTTWREIRSAPEIASRFAPLALAATEIGALQIQARGTIGGNIVTSSPVGDSLPVLLALDAELELVSARGLRRLPYREFCTGYRRTQLAADELIAAIILPAPTPGARLVWRKVGTRRSQAISKVMAAATIHIEHGRVASARVALGAVADRPIRATAVENAVVGLPLKQAGDAARAALASSIRPIDDIRSTASYRLTVAQNVVARFFTGA